MTRRAQVRLLSLLVLSQVCASTACGEEPLAAFLRQKWAECSSTHRDSIEAELARFSAQWNLDATAGRNAQARARSASSTRSSPRAAPWTSRPAAF